MDVSVIIVNYNTLELTKNTIESVFEKTKELKYEIILVDNASTDGSVDFFENNYKNKIIFIKNTENLGFGKANNRGIEIAKGKYVFLLNSDTLLINNAIKILFDFMEKTKECGICGGNLYTKELQPTHSFLRKFPSLLLEIQEYIKKKEKIRNDFNYTNFEQEVAYITGADMFIRKEILEKSGYFDKDFFMYFEETELSYRIKRLGYKIVSVPQAKIIHLEGKSTIFKERKFTMYLESKYKFYYKLYSLGIVKLHYYLYKVKYLINIKNDRRKLQLTEKVYQNFIKNYKNIRKDY